MPSNFRDKKKWYSFVDNAHFYFSLEKEIYSCILWPWLRTISIRIRSSFKEIISHFFKWIKEKKIINLKLNLFNQELSSKDFSAENLLFFVKKLRLFFDNGFLYKPLNIKYSLLWCGFAPCSNWKSHNALSGLTKSWYSLLISNISSYFWTFINLISLKSYFWFILNGWYDHWNCF